MSAPYRPLNDQVDELAGIARSRSVWPIVVALLFLALAGLCGESNRHRPHQTSELHR